MESRSLKLQIWPMRCISFDQISICFLKIYTNLPPAPQNWDFCLLWKNWILWQHWACTVFVIPFRCTVSFQFASILFCYLPVLVSFTCFFGDWRDLVFGPWIWGIAELYILQLWSNILVFGMVLDKGEIEYIFFDYYLEFSYSVFLLTVVSF